MGIFDDIKNSLGLSGEDDEEKVIEKKEPEPQKVAATVKPPEDTEKEPTPNNVFDFNSAAALNKENVFSRPNIQPTIQPKNSKAEIKTIKPKTFNDAHPVAKLLRENIAVIVNLEETDPAEAQRIVDFISGTTYAVEGKMRPISKKVFIFAPNVVKVESYEDEKKSKGNFFD